jgi:integrase
VKKIAAGDRQPATLAYYKESLARLDKKLTRLPLAALGARRDLVVDAHKDITRRNGAAAADHTIVALRSVYNHALRTWQDLPANPCIAVDFNGIRSRSDSGMGLGDLPAWWAEVSKIRNPVKQQLLLFMLLTGLRSADARTARHDDLDIQGKLLHVPKPKGGPRRAFDLPLSDPALDCIANAKSAWAEAGHPPTAYLFPSARNDKGYFETPRVERYVNGQRDRSLATGHALRHSFATICEACGYTEATYGPLLNHKAMSVTAKYANRAKNVDLYRAVTEHVGKAIMEALQQ